MISPPAAPRSAEERLAASYRRCEQVARTEARNFYFSFLPLPPDKRAAMCAVYAFMRASDDMTDDPAAAGDRQAALDRWRRSLEGALKGEFGGSEILPAFADTVRRFEIPHRYFWELIDGAAMDLTTTRYATWAELRRYCYLVASVVGFVCIHVWGFDPAGGKALEQAEACGLAFQLTNILRDVAEDAGRGRIYLPLEDLERFNVTEEQIFAGRMDERFRALMAFEAERARGFYEASEGLAALVRPGGRASLSIMRSIYRGILDEIVRAGYQVFGRRASVSTPRKLAIVASAWLSSRRAPR